MGWIWINKVLSLLIDCSEHWSIVLILKQNHVLYYFGSLIWSRSADRWIEADPWLWPTEYGIQRTAGVKASLQHNQNWKKTKEKQPPVSEAFYSPNSVISVLFFENKKIH